MDRAALSPLLRSFERHLRAENRSEHTIASYLESLRQAEAFLASRGRSLIDARREDLEAFLGKLLQRRASETVATRYRRLRVLYRWLEEEDDSRSCLVEPNGPRHVSLPEVVEPACSVCCQRPGRASAGRPTGRRRPDAAVTAEPPSLSCGPELPM
jgi:site-specific recombinase XerD